MHQGKDSDFDKIPKKPSKFRLEQFSQEELILLTDDKFINKDKVAISIVLLLSLCCENCYAPFQVNNLLIFIS